VIVWRDVSKPIVRYPIQVSGDEIRCHRWYKAQQSKSEKVYEAIVTETATSIWYAMHGDQVFV